MNPFRGRRRPAAAFLALAALGALVPGRALAQEAVASGGETTTGIDVASGAHVAGGADVAGGDETTSGADAGSGVESTSGGESAASAEAPREAVELFQRAREHYRHGRYEAAATDLENAVVLDPDSPTLLYNLGRVYELWGQHDRAIATYQRYLLVIPAHDAAERERTEAAIQRLQGAREYVRPDEEAYSQPIYVSQRGVADELFWITLASGAAITLAAAGLAIATELSYDDATRFRIGADGEFLDRQARFDDVATLATATDVVGAIGGAALLSAGLLWLLREQTVELYPSSAPVVVDLAPHPRGGAVLAVRGTF